MKNFEALDWKQMNKKSLSENAKLMYQMLSKIAGEREAWSVKQVRDLLNSIAKKELKP